MTAPLFYPYQRAWIADDSRFKCGMFARQTGKTFATTFEIARACQLADVEGRKERWVILSRGERQAKEAMEEGVKRHCQALGALVEAHENDYQTDGATYRALEVQLPGGSRITALPANPDTARGFSANVFLDEFAFHQDSRKIWTALFPVISAGHRLRVVSTPNGKGNKFYDLMTAGDALWYRQTTDIYQAVADGLPRDIEQLRLALGDADAWAQEYELKWLDEAAAWLDYDLIAGCEHRDAGKPDLYTGGPCVVGVDIAARGDLFVIWVDELVGDVAWCREIIARKRISFREQDALLDGCFRRYKVVRCCMDQTGMGEKPVEDARNRHGSRVEGVLFTGPNKLALATLGKEQFEDKRCRIPAGMADLRADLHKLKKVIGPTGAPRFIAESDGAGHADRAWAKFLAASAAKNPGLTEFDIQTALEGRTKSLLRGFIRPLVRQY
ncbi:MAG: terminase family protein [Desulfobulbaceae bacterium]|jgi:phage FluMu gp28-like protein|nr:terminase family protein [Desulfobulbaceae bacterium]